MTRKDFIMVAKAVAESNLHPSDQMCVFNKLGTELKRAYPRFNSDKWNAFCSKFIKEG